MANLSRVTVVLDFENSPEKVIFRPAPKGRGHEVTLSTNGRNFILTTYDPQLIEDAAQGGVHTLYVDLVNWHTVNPAAWTGQPSYDVLVIRHNSGEYGPPFKRLEFTDQGIQVHDYDESWLD